MKLLIIDDNIQLLNGLKNTINWNLYEIDEVYSAYNGREALNIYREQLPDIVITDILMPEMTGLEFLEAAKSINPDVKVIIMSGYAEFQYAIKAIQLGAIGYELKPIQQEALLSLVTKAILELKESKNTENLIHQQLIQTQNDTLMNILHGNISDPLQIQQFFQDHYGFGKKTFVVVVAYRIIQHSKKSLNSCIDEIQSFFKNMLKNEPEFNYLGYEENTCYICFRNSNSTLEEFNKLQTSIHLLSKLNTRIYNHNLVFQAGVGKSHSLNDIKLSYLEARQALTYIEMNPSSDFFHFTSFKPEKNTELHQQQYIVINRLFKEDISGEYFTHECINKIFAYFHQYHLYLREDCIDISIKIIEEIQKHFFKLTNCSGDFLTTEFFKAIHRATTCDECEELCIDFYQKLQKQVLDISPSSNSVPIRKAQQYINTHFAEPLSVTTIAKQVGITANYLSHTFSSECGVSMIEYINMIRIQKSKELLIHSDKMIYEIAELVGYSNYIHFTQVFKKLEGQSPSQFRKNNS